MVLLLASCFNQQTYFSSVKCHPAFQIVSLALTLLLSVRTLNEKKRKRVSERESPEFNFESDSYAAPFRLSWIRDGVDFST